MSGRLADRTVIVAGGGAIGSGMSNGRAAALAYAREGARVLVADLDRGSALETQELVRAEGGGCDVYVGDLSVAGNVEAMVAHCVQCFGGVDVLHNNIGIIRVGGPVELTEEDWDRVVTVNLKTLYLTARYVVPVMEKQRSGVITNIGSLAGLRFTGLPMIAYSTTKGAIPAFTRSLALQYAASGIRANCIHPGVIDTPLQASTDEAYGAGGDAEALRARRAATVPLGRFGSPFDVANAAVFLASPEAQYITGTELVVDGGLIQKAG
ncbi:SDR family oxidoreductase [Mycobacterium sp. 21AC1]|uniref:SDR family NAD(P)-dependent oxidoreductase n=1 Tax=[Mycobacterium] appelbergii TaxID=2939269 RepID=UPI002938F91E|nr:SDR family oxidoreductase [Mycobacterium sp. 21AC1]MDV3130204.1 SDR family oxidoreductase [Mycobacterium sp. 21AC1]